MFRLKICNQIMFLNVSHWDCSIWIHFSCLLHIWHPDGSPLSVVVGSGVLIFDRFYHACPDPPRQINTKRKKRKRKKKGKTCSKNVYTIEAIQWTFVVYLILFTDFFHAVFICLNYFYFYFFFLPEIDNISFSTIARCSSK